MLIAVLFTNYGPYHLARLKSLHQTCQKMNWQLVGIELARSEADYKWNTQIDNFPCEIISVIENKSLESASFTEVVSSLISILNRIRPDVLGIAGYARATMLSALFWSFWHRKPAILFSATTENDAPRSEWREMFKSYLLKFYQAAVAGGNPHKRYLMKLGMPADAIFIGYDVVGNDEFHPDKIGHLDSPLDRPFFLSINRFVSKKNLPFIISAYVKYRQQIGDEAWDLVLCGDGHLFPQIQKLVAEFELEDYIHLPGFLQQQEMLPFFANASCFIHASITEQWGLVVNEAMAAGLPVIISQNCGCFEDLILEGVNGYGFDPYNHEQLINLMLKMSSGSINLQSMGQASLKHIQNYSPDYFAQNLIQAVEYVVTS